MNETNQGSSPSSQQDQGSSPVPTSHDQVASQRRDHGDHFYISHGVGILIIVVFVFCIPGWFLSDLFNAKGFITFFSIFFTVLSTATEFFQIVFMRKGNNKTLPPWLLKILDRIKRLSIPLQDFKKPAKHTRSVVSVLALAAILLGTWNVYIDFYYQLDAGPMLLSAFLLLVGIAGALLSFLFSLPLESQNKVPLINSLRKRFQLKTWLPALLLLVLTLSGFWNIGQYRIADVCAGAPAATSANGIGAIVRGRECVGLSDGSIIFDASRPDGNQKQEAANQLRHKAGRATVLSLYNDAIATDPTDAEALIYQEDQQVVVSQHITIVVAATLSGLYISDGRDTLRGVYVAQKEYNDKCRREGPDCPLLNVLIANTGSGISDEVRYSHDVAVQIMQAAKKDPTIVAIMDGLASQSTFDINEEVITHPDRILPMVAAKATSDFLVRMPHFLRVAPPNILQAQMGAKYAKTQLQSSRVAIFYRQENTYSGNLKDDFINEYQDGSHQVVAVEAYPGRNPGILRDKLTAVLALKPDLIYCACYSNEVSVILEHLPTTGPFAHLLVLGGDAFFEMGDFTPGALAHLSRLRFTALAYPEIWRDLPMTNVSFFTNYGDLFEPTNLSAAEGFGFTHLTPGIMVAYDATLAITTAATRAFVTGKQAHTPQNLERALFQIQGKQAIQGITGQISVGANGEPINKAIVVLSIDNDNKFHCIWLYGQFLAGKPAPPDQLNNGQTCTTAAGSRVSEH
jgi:ABC-type branched-subunit amino acid transport system substrate-binding protein